MPNEVIIVEVIRQIAAKTNTALQAKGFGRQLYYDYGHPKEINQRLQEQSKSPTEGGKKFPRIILLTDITIRHTITGMYGTASLNFLICNLTKAEYTAQKRTEVNFVPILHPIKKEFVEQMRKWPGFTYPEEPVYSETDCYYYGSQINDKNVFNDRIDAIQINGFNVNITLDICNTLTSNL